MSNENIKLDPKNYRVHNDKNKKVIRQSLEECGAGRSVLMDKENVMIAGNGVYEQAKQLGIPVRIIESDGKELVVIKRTDLSTDDEKRKLLALADNHASDLSDFDIELVLQDFSPEELNLWEFSVNTDDFNEFMPPEPKDLTADKKDAPPTIKLTFKSIKQMDAFEVELKTIIERYEGMSYSISAGEI